MSDPILFSTAETESGNEKITPVEEGPSKNDATPPPPDQPPIP
jgi:hypothetical protein